MRPAKHVRLVIPLLCLLWLSCRYFSDLVSPQEFSIADFSGCVLDSLYGTPLAGVTVRLDGSTAVTDTSGCYRFNDIRTGSAVVGFEHDGYRTRSVNVHVELHNAPDTALLLRRNHAPSVELFTVTPVTTLSRRDTVTFRFVATDSTGPIWAVSVDFGDHSGPYIPNLGTPDSVSGEIRHVYEEPGTYTAVIRVMDWYGQVVGDSSVADTSAPESTTVTVSPNYPPSARIYAAQGDAGEFANGFQDFIQVTTFDSDDGVMKFSLDYGDASEVETSFDSTETFWHTYDTERDTQLTVTVKVWDTRGAVSKVRRDVLVRRVDPPTLGPLEIEPTPNLGSSDSTVTIVVPVLKVDGYVEEIVWLVNNQDTTDYDARYFEAVSYNDSTGAVPAGGAGKEFSHTLSLVSWLRKNTVEVIVRDSYGQERTATGAFWKYE